MTPPTKLKELAERLQFRAADMASADSRPWAELCREAAAALLEAAEEIERLKTDQDRFVYLLGIQDFIGTDDLNEARQMIDDRRNGVPVTLLEVAQAEPVAWRWRWKSDGKSAPWAFDTEHPKVLDGDPRWTVEPLYLGPSAEQIRREAFEEAAKLCEEHAARWEADGVPVPMSRLCAAAIRQRGDAE